MPEKIKNISTISKYLICLIPPSLITGPFIPDLIVVILSILFLIEVFFQKKFYLFQNIFFKIFLVYWLYIVLISFFSENTYVSLRSSFFYIRFGLLFLIIKKCFEEHSDFFKKFFLSLTLVFLVLFFDSLIQFFFKKNIFLYKLHSGRVSSFFKDELILGSYSVRFYFIYLGFLFLNFKTFNKKNYFYFINIILIPIIIILSGERTALLLLLLGILLSFFLIQVNFKYKIYLLSYMLISSIVLILYFPDIKSRIIQQTKIEFGASEKKYIQIINKKPYKFASQHLLYFDTALKIFYDNPLGSGNNTYRYQCKKYSNIENNFSNQLCATHPHNTYFQLLSENGIFGFGLISFIFIYLNYFFLKICFNKNSYPNSKIFFLIAIYINIFPIIQTGNFFNNWLSIVYYLPLGFLLASFKNIDKKVVK